VRWLELSSKSAEVIVLSTLAFLLAAESGFALQCHMRRRQMATFVSFAQHRQRACLELGWRWEADDQESQYGPSTSAGTQTTVAPISGFVMDVTEDEEGHTEGQCHAVHAAYEDLISRNGCGSCTSSLLCLAAHRNIKSKRPGLRGCFETQVAGS
jgi:hypothetical protein